MKNHQISGHCWKSIAVAGLAAGIFVSAPAYSGETCDALSKRASVVSALYHSMWNTCQQGGNSFNVCYEETDTWRNEALRAWDAYQACKD